MTASAPLQHLIERLPHGEPFRFISEIRTLEPAQHATGLWNLTGDEDFFRGHFPGAPLVPGVLLAEALAQLAGIVVFGDDPRPRPARLAHVDLKFPSGVTPPASVALEARLQRALGPLWLMDVQATCSNTIVARGMLTLAESGAL